MHNEPDNSPKISDFASGRAVAINPLDLFCNFISWVLVPLMTPVYAVLILEFFFPIEVELENKFLLPFYIFLITAVAPAVIFELLKRFGVLSDIALNKQRERTVPYIVVILSYVACAFLVMDMNIPLLFGFFLGGASAASINLVYNLRWKVSAHAAGVGGVVAILMNMLHHEPTTGGLAWLCVWLLLCGLLGFARIWLRRHTLLQVLVGFANGFFFVWIFTVNYL